MNKQNKTTIHRYRHQNDAYQRGRDRGSIKWVKRVKCVVIDRNKTFGGEHTRVYTDI